MIRTLVKNNLIACGLFVGAFVGCGDVFSDLCIPDIDPLCDFQKKFGGYDYGDTLHFSHSNGYTFDLAVVKDDVSYRTDDGGLYNREKDIPCNENGPTTAVRLRSVRLEAVFPMLSIDLEMDGDNRWSQSIEVYMGQYRFSLNRSDFEEKSSEKSRLVDSVEVNGHVYRNVAVVEGVRHTEKQYAYDGVQGVKKNDAPSSAKMYYLEKKGIIKIELEDGSFIALKENLK